MPSPRRGPPGSGGPVRSGYLLRSHAVAGWPDLVITADGDEPLHTTLLSAGPAVTGPR